MFLKGVLDIDTYGTKYEYKNFDLSALFPYLFLCIFKM